MRNQKPPKSPNYFFLITPLAISLASLIISFKSCENGKKSIELSGKNGEAFIQIVNVSLSDTLNSMSFIKLNVTLKNLGQVPAKEVSGEMDYNVGLSPQGKNGNSASRRLLPSLGQGYETKIQIVSNRINRRDFKAGYFNHYETLFFYGTIFYTDGLSKKQKKVDWTYELPLNSDESLNELELKPSHMFLYESPYKVEMQ